MMQHEELFCEKRRESIRLSEAIGEFDEVTPRAGIIHDGSDIAAR